jgi:hypothetical protein
MAVNKKTLIKSNNSKGTIWWLKLNVEPNNGIRHFCRTLHCGETKGMIYSLIIPAIKTLPKEPWRHKVGIVYKWVPKRVDVILFTVSVM